MDIVDVMLLSCGVDNDALDDILDTMLFIEEGTNAEAEHDEDGTES